MKKLMTVSKSKYYMLKVSYKAIFEEVDFEMADSAEDGYAAPEDGERIHTDLKRNDTDPKASTSTKQDLINRLKNPTLVNVSESLENLDNEDQKEKR